MYGQELQEHIKAWVPRVQAGVVTISTEREALLFFSAGSAAP